MSDSQPGPYDQPFGQHPGQHPYAPPPPPGYGVPDRRPGTVTGAAVITVIMAGLSLVLFGVGAVAVLAAPDTVVEEVERQFANDPTLAELTESGMTLEQMVRVTGAGMLVMAVLSVIGVALGAFAFRRSSTVRVLLTVWCGLVALVSIPFVLAGLGVVSLASSVAVIALLFSRSAKAWYAGTRQAPTYPPPGGQGQYPPSGSENPDGQG